MKTVLFSKYFLLVYSVYTNIGENMPINPHVRCIINIIYTPQSSETTACVAVSSGRLNELNDINFHLWQFEDTLLLPLQTSSSSAAWEDATGFRLCSLANEASL